MDIAITKSTDQGMETVEFTEINLYETPTNDVCKFIESVLNKSSNQKTRTNSEIESSYSKELQNQNTVLQERNTELVEENRKLEERIRIINEDYKYGNWKEGE